MLYTDGIRFCLRHRATPIGGHNSHFTILQTGLPNPSLHDQRLGCYWSCLGVGPCVLLR